MSKCALYNINLISLHIKNEWLEISWQKLIQMHIHFISIFFFNTKFALIIGRSKNWCRRLLCTWSHLLCWRSSPYKIYDTNDYSQAYFAFATPRYSSPLNASPSLPLLKQMPILSLGLFHFMDIKHVMPPGSMILTTLLPRSTFLPRSMILKPMLPRSKTSKNLPSPMILTNLFQNYCLQLIWFYLQIQFGFILKFSFISKWSTTTSWWTPCSLLWYNWHDSVHWCY